MVFSSSNMDLVVLNFGYALEKYPTRFGIPSYLTYHDFGIFCLQTRMQWELRLLNPESQHPGLVIK